MWTLLISLFSKLVGSSLSSVSKDLKEAYQSKLSAQNDTERIAADERIKLLEARKDSILAAQSDPYERWVRIGFALPFVAYVNKVVFYDKVLGWGVTDPLSADLKQLLWVVVGGFFVDITAKGVIRQWKK